MTNKKVVLYAVSPIGLGHASRAVAVGRRMLSSPEMELTFVSGAKAASFIRSYGFRVEEGVKAPTPSERHGEMKYSSLWYLRYWISYRSTLRSMKELFDGLAPDLVVSDEEFTSISLALERGIPHALIADELELGFARGWLSSMLERRVTEWYSGLQRRVSQILVPDFGEDRGNIRFMTPAVRETTRTREEIYDSLGIGREKHMILLSASGSGIGRFLLDAVLDAFKRGPFRDSVLVVTGLAGAEHEPGRIIPIDFERDNQDLVAAATLVISTAGKSTIDEARSSGTPIIAIPIKNHSEQERNARSLGFTYDDLGRMDALMAEGMRRGRGEPGRFRGAEAIASHLVAAAELRPQSGKE